jgi:deoxyinosine 3'endonuclease (endonuclease V)
MKNIIKKWLGLDKTEKELMRVQNELAEALKTLDIIKNCVQVGADYGFKDTSWAVVCVAGKVEYVKFFKFNDKNSQAFLSFIRQFKEEYTILDLPGRIPKKLFLGK